MCQSNKFEREIKKKLEVKQGANQKSGGPWPTQAPVESPLAGKILENKENAIETIPMKEKCSTTG